MSKEINLNCGISFFSILPPVVQMKLFSYAPIIFFVRQKHLSADDSGWSQAMLDYIRNSDETVLKGCDKARVLTML